MTNAIKRIFRSWYARFALFLISIKPVAKGAYNLIDAAGNTQTVIQQYQSVLNFFNTGWGTIVLMVTGVGFMLLAIYTTEKRKTKSPQSAEAKENNPEQVIPLVDTEELTEQVRLLEREKDALEKARKYASDLYEGVRTENDTLQMCLTDKINDLESYKWLDEIVEYQRKGLRKYVLVEKCDINAAPLSEGKLYVEFTFLVVNYSMFTVSIPMPIDAVIEGSIRFKGDLLSGMAKLVVNEVKNHLPCLREYFKVRQWVSRDEAKDISDTLERVGNLFDFSQAIIPVRGGDRFPNVEMAQLDLTRGMQAVGLENKIIKLGNANALLERELISWQEGAKYIEELHLALGACYQAYNQSEQRELLSIEAFKSLKMRISHALSCKHGEAKMLFDFYDEQPLILDSIDKQKEWIDSQCFKLRELIQEERQKQLVAHKEANQS